MKTIPKKLVKATIASLKHSAKDKGVSIKVSPYKNVRCNSLLCSGYFVDGTKPMLAFATGKPANDWVGIALHESSHMDQWYEQSPVWKDGIVGSRVDGSKIETLDLIEEWIHGKNVNTKLLKKYLLSSLNVELDCEKRTVEKIKQFKLDDYINVSEYIQKSNAYVLFYLAILKTRKWYSVTKKPYEMKKVWSKMPKKFNLDYNDFDQPLVDLLIKECF